MKLLVSYPHIPAVHVYRDGFDDIYFGTDHEGNYDRVIYTATTETAPARGKTLLCLEPPIVEPWAYDISYRSQFRTVYSFAGPDTGNVVFFKHGIPPLWPELPETIDEFPWDARLNAVVAVIGNKHNRHDEVADMGRRVESLGLEFHLYGRPAFNLPHWYKGEIDGDKRMVLRRYKYCWCPENSAISRYMTEKLPDALSAGCVPIYDKGADAGNYRDLPWPWVLAFPTRVTAEEVKQEFWPQLNERWPRIREALATKRLWELLLRTSR